MAIINVVSFISNVVSKLLSFVNEVCVRLECPIWDSSVMSASFFCFPSLTNTSQFIAFFLYGDYIKAQQVLHRFDITSNM